METSLNSSVKRAEKRAADRIAKGCTDTVIDLSKDPNPEVNPKKGKSEKSTPLGASGKPSKDPQGPKGKYWCFTRHKPPKEPEVEWPAYVKYASWQLEKSANGLHWQGYVELNDMKRARTLKRDMFEAHWALKYEHSTREQAREYTRKEDSRVEGPWEHGQFEGGQRSGKGKRTDLLAFKKALESGQNEEDLKKSDETFGFWLRYPGVVDRWNNSGRKPVKRANIQMIVCVGPPGTGKSRWAAEAFPDAYWKPVSSKEFWPKYSGEKTVVFDEMYGGYCPLHEMLTVVSEAPYQVNKKGSEFDLLATTFVFTSNKPPWEWYDPKLDSEPLLSRITKWGYFPRHPEKVTRTKKFLKPLWVETQSEFANVMGIPVSLDDPRFEEVPVEPVVQVAQPAEPVVLPQSEVLCPDSPEWVEQQVDLDDGEIIPQTPGMSDVEETYTGSTDNSDQIVPLINRMYDLDTRLEADPDYRRHLDEMNRSLNLSRDIMALWDRDYDSDQAD